MNINDHRSSIVSEVIPRAGVLCRLNRKTTERVFELLLNDDGLLDDLQDPVSELTRDADAKFYSHKLREQYERTYGLDPITIMILSKVIAYAVEAFIRWYLASRDSRLKLSGFRAALSAHRSGLGG